MNWNPFGKKKISDIGNLKIDLSLQDLKRVSRILVIDDDKNSFPIDVLKDEHYNIEYWPEVKSLEDLESGKFDIIVLDIIGVAEKIGKDDGMGVLEALKQNNPSQIIIAFSGQTFDISKNRFFQLADDVLSKPADVFQCKDKIDFMLKEKFTISNYWGNLEAILLSNGVNHEYCKEIESRMIDAIEGKDSSELTGTLHKYLNSPEKINTALNIVNTILRIAEVKSNA